MLWVNCAIIYKGTLLLIYKAIGCDLVERATYGVAFYQNGCFQSQFLFLPNVVPVHTHTTPVSECPKITFCTHNNSSNTNSNINRF